MNDMGHDLTAISISDILGVIFYFSITTVLYNNLRRIIPKISNFFLIVVAIHLIATIFYWYYSLHNIADSQLYYRFATSNDLNMWYSLLFKQDTSFIIFLTFPLTNFFYLSYFGVFLVFSTLGLIGFYYLIRTVLLICGNSGIIENRKDLLFLLLPGVHFWSCALGKDSIIFLFICLFYYSYFSRSHLLFVFACVGVYFVRPHILILLLVGILFSIIFFSKRFTRLTKFGLILLFSGIIFIGGILMLERFGIQDFDSTEDVITLQLQANQGGGTSVDMSEANILIKVGSYLFRPFLFEANNVMTLFSSLENLIWMFLIYRIITALFNRKFRYCFPQSLALGLCSLVLLVALSYILNNLGIAFRQKTMIFPSIFILFFLSGVFNKKLGEKGRKYIIG